MLDFVAYVAPEKTPQYPSMNLDSFFLKNKKEDELTARVYEYLVHINEKDKEQVKLKCVSSFCDCP
jgi:hypothetical protein